MTHDVERTCEKDERDRLTGLLTRIGFKKEIESYMRGSRFAPGGSMVYFDVQRFKLINHMFGMAEGDRLLQYIAAQVIRIVGDRGYGCRLNADRFAFILFAGREETERCIQLLFDAMEKVRLPFAVLCNAGIYVIEEASLQSDEMIDRAIMAQSRIKGSYTKRFSYYSEDIKEELFGEQEIAGMVKEAVETEQFLVYYQPQYNHATGLLVGAEALARWEHPEKGMIMPGQFIPVFERNGFITQLDLYVFAHVCSFLRQCLDEGLNLVPVAINLTRNDIFVPGFIEKLEEIRKSYGVSSQYIRIELTESSALGSSDFLNEVIRRFHDLGYRVEMDDFGSGYSSLNILKDVEFDVIKLDMRFLHDNAKQKVSNNRGGIVLSAVVRMLNWLRLPMIAEGVETAEQADFLKSIGCEYIQGYLYSRPLPQEAYHTLLAGSHIGKAAPSLHLIETLNADGFWSDDSLETLIFSNYVGAAAILDYHENMVELLRVNDKYLQEIGMNLKEPDFINRNLLDDFGESGKLIYIKMLEDAIETGEEQECETWRKISSDCCGEERICIRSTVKVIGRSRENYIFHAMIRNITAEKKYYSEILDSERRFKMASEQINIYYWEYIVATREMHPCFRCMRDLGFPAVLKNYPDSAIEMGVFPPEVADMYRDWHRQIAEGVPSLEAVIPLTVGRIPFHVRYTTEFDENGRAIKAYGSAALVVQEDSNG